MELSEALPILQRLYEPLWKDMKLRLYDDHICDRDHPLGSYPYPDSAKYTKNGRVARHSGIAREPVAPRWFFEAVPR